MLLESDKFDPAGTLPDVSKGIVLPKGVASVSALAGINSGTDYAKAIYAAAYRPLEPEKKKQQPATDPLETDPTAPTVSKAAVERREMANSLRRAVGGSGRPDYVAPVYPSADLPGESPPVASGGDPGNLLGAPPPDDSLFPTAPSPILPPPLETKSDVFNPADIFPY